MEGVKNRTDQLQVSILGRCPSCRQTEKSMKNGRDQLLVSVLERCTSYRDVRHERLDCVRRTLEICAVMKNAGSLKIAQNITSEAAHRSTINHPVRFLCGYTCEVYGLPVLSPQYSSYVHWYCFRQV